MSGHPAEALAKAAGDVLSVSVVVGTLVQYLPAIAAAFTIVWTGIRVYYFLKDRWSGKTGDFRD